MEQAPLFLLEVPVILLIATPSLLVNIDGQKKEKFLLRSNYPINNLMFPINVVRRNFFPFNFLNKDNTN